MPYELSVFQQIVQGSLSPLYFPVEPFQTESLSRWYEQLHQRPATATRQVHAQFQKEHDAFVIHALQVQLVDPYQTPTFQAPHYRVEAFPDQEHPTGETLLYQVLERLKLDREAVLEWYHWQDRQAQLHLELYAAYPLEVLSAEERRYHYYQYLLFEQVGLVQQRLMTYVHQTPSRKKASKYVQDHQRALLHFTQQVVQYLDEESPRVYTFQEDYRLPDVYRLVFRSLDQLTSYVEEHFGQYLDTTAPAPYRRRALQAVTLQEQLTALVPWLDESSVDESLRMVLEEPFAQIRALPHQEVSYQKLFYLQKLLQALGQAYPKEATSISSDSLVAVLFRLNFNSTAFLQYLTTYLQEQLTEVATIEEKLSLLHYYRKFYKQLPLQAELAYQPEEKAVDEQVLAWISEEIAYQQKMQAEPFIQPEPTGQERIKTTMTVAQMALLIRLLTEVNLLPKQNLANVFRRFSSTFYSHKQETVQADSLRGKYAQHDTHTIEVLKEKVSAMLNFLRTL